MSWIIKAANSAAPSAKDLMQEIKVDIESAINKSRQGSKLYSYSPNKSALDNYIASMFTTLIMQLQDLPEMLSEDIKEEDLIVPEEDR